jgi:hypothetical protein
MTRIIDLTQVATVEDPDEFPIGQASSGRTRSVAFSTVKANINAEVNDAVIEAVEAAERAVLAETALRNDLADGVTVDNGAALVAFSAGETLRQAVTADRLRITGAETFDADLQDPIDPAKGAALVGFNTGTADESLRKSGAYKDKASLISDTVLAYADYPAGTVITTRDGALFEVADAAETRYHAVTAGGVKLIDPAFVPSRVDNPIHFGSAFPRFSRRMQQFKYGKGGSFTNIEIMGLGSSVANGATLATPLVDAPLYWFVNKLNEKINPAGIYAFTPVQKAVGGSAIVEANQTFFPAAISAGVKPKMVPILYGMNDFRQSLFNSGQTFPGGARHLRELVLQAKAAGADPIIFTTPHPHTGRVSYSLPPTVGQIYPETIAMPVADEAMTPPVSASVLTGDYSGLGIDIDVDHRFLRGNEMLRQVAFETGCALIDVEKYWFEAVANFGIDALYDVGEEVHPNLLGHHASYHRAIDDFVSALSYTVSAPAPIPDTFDVISLGAGATQLAYDQGPVLSGAVLDVRGRTEKDQTAIFRGADGIADVQVDKATGGMDSFAYNQSRTSGRKFRRRGEQWLNKTTAQTFTFATGVSGQVIVTAATSADGQVTRHSIVVHIAANSTTITSDVISTINTFGSPIFNLTFSGLVMTMTPVAGGNINFWMQAEYWVV